MVQWSSPKSAWDLSLDSPEPGKGIEASSVYSPILSERAFVRAGLGGKADPQSSLTSTLVHQEITSQTLRKVTATRGN